MTVYILGAGLAGLSAAVFLAKRGVRDIVLYEQSAGAGGRCRSFYDPFLEMTVDNGSHLLLSGNTSAQAYLETIGSWETLVQPDPAMGFAFYDLKTQARWALPLGRLRTLLWMLDRRSRIPGTSFFQYLSGIYRLFPSGRTVLDRFGDHGALYHRFWEPLALAVLNTPASQAAADLFWPVFKETFARGASGATPLVPRVCLQDTFITPALSWLKDRGVEIKTGYRIKGLERGEGRVTGLYRHGVLEKVGPQDWVISALPAHVLGELVPEIEVPSAFSPIVNVHYGVPSAVSGPRFVGLVGGIGHWVFQTKDLISVTIGAADDLLALGTEAIADTLWPEVQGALSLPGQARPKARVIKEHRATILTTPDEVARRPGVKTPWTNFFLCGEWTNTGLPTTMEGALRSGHWAADRVQRG